MIKNVQTDDDDDDDDKKNKIKIEYKIKTVARLNRVRIIKYDVNNVCVFVIWGFNVLFTCNRSKLRVLLYCLTLTCTSVGEKEQITM